MMNQFIQEISATAVALIFYSDEPLEEDTRSSLKAIAEKLDKPIFILQNHSLSELNDGDLSKYGLQRVAQEEVECPCPECTSQD
ncbi:MAG: hypothetical protein ACK4FN_00745 [Acinetobacter johnsonii]